MNQVSPYLQHYAAMLHLSLHHHMTSIEPPDDTQALQRLVGELSVFNPAKKIDAIHRSILFKERAPRKQLLQVLKDRNADVRAAAAEAVEALQEWITDEQWLEALQENTRQASFVAIDVLASCSIGPMRMYVGKLSRHCIGWEKR